MFKILIYLVIILLILGGIFFFTEFFDSDNNGENDVPHEGSTDNSGDNEGYINFETDDDVFDTIDDTLSELG